MEGFAGNNAQQPERPLSMYESHEKAVSEWHEACKDFARADARRVQARTKLEKLTSALAEYIQRNLNDPTCPTSAAETKGGQSLGQLGTQAPGRY